MYRKEVNAQSPLRILEQSIHGGLGKGNLGVVMARAGVGKTACLVQIGLDDLMRERGVFHLALGQTLDHVRSWYDALFDDMATRTGLDAREEVRATINRRRVIKTGVEQEHLSERAGTAIEMFHDLAEFEPAVILVDGFDWSGPGDKTRKELEALKDLARRVNAELWVSARTHRDATGDHPTGLTAPCDAHADLIDVAIFLEPREGRRVELRLLKDHGDAPPPDTHLRLHADTMRLVAEGETPTAAAIPRTGFVLLSGGVRGAEAEFGACAEKYGLTEKTFSFKGHEIERKRGLVLLSDDELTRRQVSALYLKAHMHRDFPNTDLFRRVLASIWHQVSSANEVFAVGVILDNKTVMGGTGWAVELAKNFTLPLWVFDQEKKSWFTWKSGDWQKTADPVISGRRFTGSGTRLLSDEGRKAIRALFERSFGSGA